MAVAAVSSISIGAKVATATAALVAAPLITKIVIVAAAVLLVLFMFFIGVQIHKMIKGKSLFPSSNPQHQQPRVVLLPVVPQEAIAPARAQRLARSARQDLGGQPQDPSHQVPRNAEADAVGDEEIEEMVREIQRGAPAVAQQAQEGALVPANQGQFQQVIDELGERIVVLHRDHPRPVYAASAVTGLAALIFAPAIPGAMLGGAAITPFVKDRLPKDTREQIQGAWDGFSHGVQAFAQEHPVVAVVGAVGVAGLAVIKLPFWVLGGLGASVVSANCFKHHTAEPIMADDPRLLEAMQGHGLDAHLNTRMIAKVKRYGTYGDIAKIGLCVSAWLGGCPTFLAVGAATFLIGSDNLLGGNRKELFVAQKAPKDAPPIAQQFRSLNARAVIQNLREAKTLFLEDMRKAARKAKDHKGEIIVTTGALGLGYVISNIMIVALPVIGAVTVPCVLWKTGNLRERKWLVPIAGAGGVVVGYITGFASNLLIGIGWYLGQWIVIPTAAGAGIGGYFGNLYKRAEEKRNSTWFGRAGKWVRSKAESAVAGVISGIWRTGTSAAAGICRRLGEDDAANVVQVLGGARIEPETINGAVSLAGSFVQTNWRGDEERRDGWRARAPASVRGVVEWIIPSLRPLLQQEQQAADAERPEAQPARA